MIFNLGVGDDHIREVLNGLLLLLEWLKPRCLLVRLDFVQFLVVVFHDYAVSLTCSEGSDHIVSSILNLILKSSRRDQVALFLDRFELLEDSAQFDCRLLELF